MTKISAISSPMCKLCGTRHRFDEPHAGSVAVRDENTTLGLPGTYSATGLALPPDMPYEQWEDIGHTLRRIEGAVLWWIGDWINYGESSYGEKYAQALDATDYSYQTLANAAWVTSKVESSRRRETLSFGHHAEVAALDAADQDRWLAEAEAESLSRNDLRRRIRAPHELLSPPPPVGMYSTIVIDPPWPMEKIIRDVRPNQAAFDYQTMSEEELAALSIPAADSAHLYLWTTHKFLPMALRLAEAWGFQYQCLMTWRKNVGFTPFSWMYSTEHALFCTRGGLDLERKGLRLDFEAKVREHSRKPDEFYDLVREASPGPRIDMFSRESRDGFDTWGAEAGRFDG